MEELKAAIRRATIAGKANPVVCGSAFKNKGVQPMLDAVVDFLPSPLDIAAIEGIADGRRDPGSFGTPTVDEPFSGLAFKIQTDKHLGKLTYVRVYSGTLDSGTQVVNSTKDRKERIGKIYQMHANKREERPTAWPATSSRCRVSSRPPPVTPCATRRNPVILESMTFPEPVISVAIEPKTQGRPGEARYGDPEARRGGPDLPRQAATRRPVRRSSPAWASCTWRSWSTG